MTVRLILVAAEEHKKNVGCGNFMVLRRCFIVPNLGAIILESY